MCDTKGRHEVDMTQLHMGTPQKFAHIPYSTYISWV